MAGCQRVTWSVVPACSAAFVLCAAHCICVCTFTLVLQYPRAGHAFVAENELDVTELDDSTLICSCNVATGRNH